MGFLKKSSLLKIVAIVACFSIISLSFPAAVQAAAKKADKGNSKNFLERPLGLLHSALLRLNRAFIEHGKPHRIHEDNSNFNEVIKIAGNSTSKKTPKGKDDD